MSILLTASREPCSFEPSYSAIFRLQVSTEGTERQLSLGPRSEIPSDKWCRTTRRTSASTCTHLPTLLATLPHRQPSGKQASEGPDLALLVLTLVRILLRDTRVHQRTFFAWLLQPWQLRDLLHCGRILATSPGHQ